MFSKEGAEAEEISRSVSDLMFVYVLFVLFRTSAG